MLNKKIKRVIFFILIVIFLIILIQICVNTRFTNNIYSEIRKQAYGEPIASDGTINNEYFKIYKDETNSKQTTNGINEAIEYASKNNIEYIKLENGIYLIDGTSKTDSQSLEDKGICLKSNIVFDLNGSKIKQIKNNKTNYSIVTIINKENITIKNGILYGDKDNHDDTNGGVNDKGFGVEIRGSSNIILENLKISNLTGDGILVREILIDAYNAIESEKVEIKECNIYNNRRQGISIVSGNDIKIHDNEIYNIAGKNPQACIDLESDGWRAQKIKNIEIYSNKLYDSISKLGIMIYNGFYSGKIYDNEIDGRILVVDAKEYLKIENNIINNGGIIVNYEGQREVIFNKVFINKNIIQKGVVKLSKVKDAIMIENELKDTTTEIIDGNIAITQNKSNKEISINSLDGTNNKIYFIDNNFNLENINQELQLITDKDEMDKYINEIKIGVE